LALALAFAFALACMPGTARADGDTYKQHMENGVKLYADKNFSAAIAEFQAAYDLKPNPSPLVNIALCDKELFQYPQAIAALGKAVATYGDAMGADDKKAAEDAIREMRALLGRVRIQVAPSNAKVTVDGDEVASVAEPVLVGPGKHQVTARADGYAGAEQSVMVASGREQVVSFTLVAEKGAVTVEAPDPRMTISVDDEPRGQGRWSGMLSPGQHIVRMYGAEGPSYGSTILVAPGVPLFVNKDQGGVPLAQPRPEAPKRRGFYVLGVGSILFAATHPPDFPGAAGGNAISKPDYGAGYGLRAGFQVNDVAGFDITYEHSSIFTYAAHAAMSSDLAYYRIVANRVAADIRLISAGQSFRFVGTFGGGITDDQIFFSIPMCNSLTMPNSQQNPPCYLYGPSPNHVGVDAFALAEVGIEIDIDHVLLDFGVEGQLQSTGNLEAYGNRGVFGSLPLINVGPALRIGYRFW
jgi:hypothetical protein